MRTLFVITIFWSVCIWPLHAYDSFTADFLGINTDTRSSAMSNTGGALAAGPGGVWLNPAAIAGINAPTFTFTHMQMYEGSSFFHHAGGALKVGNALHVAVNTVLLTVPDIPAYPDFSATTDGDVYQYLKDHSADALATGTYGVYDLGLTATLTRVFKTRLDLGWQYFVIPLEIPLGINFKYIRQQIGEYGSGSGTGVDLGTLVRIDARRLFGERDFLGFFGIGLTLKDIGGTVISWESNYESVLPYTTLFAAAYEQPLARYRSTVRLCYDYDFRYAEPRAGLEYVYAGMLAARCGISPRSFTAGAGITLFGGSLDYAFDMQDFGNVHRITAGYRLGGKKE